MPVTEGRRPAAFGAFPAYALFVLAPVAALLVVLLAMRAQGAGTSAIAETHPVDHASLPALWLLLAQLAVVLAACWIVGRAVRAVGQPRVVGEMLAGILLGPSVLGAVAPAASRALFPAESLGLLAALAQAGLILFMFIVGLELELGALRRRARAALLVSHAGIAVPLLLGVLVAITLFPDLAPRGIRFGPFALFVGAALSVTAFPVLARILQEKKLTNTELGMTAIACAAVADITVWCVLAGVIVLVRAGMDGHTLMTTLRGSELFCAFAIGVIVPKDARVVRAMRTRFEGPALVVLLPLLFAFTGLRMRFDLLASGAMIGRTLIVVIVAVIGKLGGSALAARAAGVPAREALALGALMNTRGLMELVILNIGLDAGVISAAVYSMLVVMAFATTAMTTPLINRLVPPEIATSGARPA
jgi:Kef-type K+ transport system membrane component KefB